MRLPAKQFILAALTGLPGLFCRADIALYYTVEVDLTEPETIRVFLPVHAPELMFDRESTDFTKIGQEWLDGLSDSEMELLLKRSGEFVEDTFRIFSGKWRATGGYPFSFRKNDDENAPGSLLAASEFPNPGGELRVELSPNAEKRLQIAINRKGEFPGAKDLAAGESVLIALPEPPPSQGTANHFFWLRLVGIPLTVFLLFRVVRCFKTGRIRM